MKGFLIQGDARNIPLADESVQCCVTSPPYWGLRDYGHADQLGLESTPDEYVQGMVAEFREVGRVLRKDGTLWLNLGDSYSGGTRDFNSFRRDRKRVSVPKISATSGLPPKNMIGLPWRVALALQADGWILRQSIIWHKPNSAPDGAVDRCIAAHEYIFLLTKSGKYCVDKEFIRCKRSVWTVANRPSPENHFAAFPEEIPKQCILAGCPERGIVLDPFSGSGTTCAVAKRLARIGIGIDLSPEYIQMAKRRIAQGILC